MNLDYQRFPGRCYVKCSPDVWQGFKRATDGSLRVTAAVACRRLANGKLSRQRSRAIIEVAGGPGDRWLRAIGAGGKSGHRRRRLARAGDEVRATRLVTPGDGHAGSAARRGYPPKWVAPSLA